MERITRFKKEMIDLYSEVDLRQLLERITAGIRGHLACEEASIFIYDPEREELTFETATGAKSEELKRIVLKKGQGIAGWIAAERRGVIIDDCRRDPRHAAGADQKTHFQTRSLLGVPVFQGDRLLGVLEAVNKRRGKFSQADLRLLGAIATFLAIPLQNAVLIRRMLEKEKLEKELQIARTIQRSFLRQDPVVAPGLDVAFLNISSSQVGGDYYEAMPLGGREIVLSVNDVSGHGIPAALGMAVFRIGFVFHLRQNRDILATIGHLNRLIAETIEGNLYVTSCTCKLDAASGVLDYINAGHPAPLVLRDGAALALPGGGMAVGMFAESEFKAERFQLLAGDILLLFTDGVIEAADERDEEYGRERLAAAARAGQQLPAGELQAALLADVRRFCGRDDFADDFTLMVVKYLGNTTT
jgi:sigma-B regulation protein RsbU (phosphoserine phosphatase)